MENVYIPERDVRDQLGGSAAIMYDFATNGGAIGTIELPLTIPDNAVIIGAYVDVLTPPTSAGSATVALGLNTNTDVLAATAIASVTGVVVAKAQAAAFKLTAERKLKVTIATAALTAGKMAICLHWVGPFDAIAPR